MISGSPIVSRSAYRDPRNSTGNCWSRIRAPAPRPLRHSSSTTPRSLSISSSSNVTPWAQSSSTTNARSMVSGASVGTISM